MKELMMRSLVVLMLIGALAVISFAQDARVQLTAGGEGKSLTRTLAPNSNVGITFKANAGQTISFTAGYDFKESDLVIYLLTDGGEQLKKSGAKAPNEVLVKKTGDYQVVVENKTNKRITTTIYLDLFNPEDLQDDSGGSGVEPEPLSFEGSDQASVSKVIPANGTMKFTFEGTKGATAIVNVAEKTNKLTVIFNENENQKADTTIALNKDVTRKLTRTGEYTIEVVNQSAKSVKFNLEVSIEAAASTSTNPVLPIEERVEFARGETSASVTKDIPANGVVEFLFNVKKGQTVNYTVGYDFKDSDLTVYLGEPGDQDSAIPSRPKAPQTFVVKKSGDHSLEVTNTTKKKVTITLFLDVEAPASTSTNTGSSDAVRILTRGETSASVTKDIPANGVVEFLFNVKKGQAINYTVEYDFKDSDLTVYLGEPGDQDTSIPSRPKAPQTFVVKKSGDHRLEVTNTTKKKVTITLYLDIEATATSPTTGTGDASAPASERVQFPQGATDVSLERTVKANSTYDFILNIRKGQRMVFSFDGSDKLGMFLTEPGLQDISLESGPGEPNEFVVKKTGDHRITINNQSGKPMKFTLGVFIK